MPNRGAYGYAHLEVAPGVIVGPVAYRGKVGCTDVTCTRSVTDDVRCFGWHCSVCDRPCSMQGHHGGCPEVRDA
jgi:hypothetical protein